MTSHTSNPVRLLALLYTATLFFVHIFNLPRVFTYCNGIKLRSKYGGPLMTLLRPYPQRLLGCIRLPTLHASVTKTLSVGLGAGLLYSIAGPLQTSRISLAASAGLALLLFSQLRDLHTVRRKANTVPVVLAILAVAPGVDDDWQACPPHWPLFAVGLVLVQVYVSAAVEKLRQTGMAWSRGHVLRWALTDHALLQGTSTSPAQWPASVLRVLSTSVLALELGAPLSFFSPQLTCIYGALGFSFHVANSLLLGIHYFYILPAYAVVIVTYFCEPAALWSGPQGMACVGAMGAILLTVTVTGRPIWPFDKYPMYAHAPPSVAVYRLSMEGANGEQRLWYPPLLNDLERIHQMLGRWYHGDASVHIDDIIALALALHPPLHEVRQFRVVRRSVANATIVEHCQLAHRSTAVI